MSQNLIENMDDLPEDLKTNLLEAFQDKELIQ